MRSTSSRHFAPMLQLVCAAAAEAWRSEAGKTAGGGGGARADGYGWEESLTRPLLPPDVRR